MASPYIEREMARLYPSKIKPHPVGVGRCERCIWRRVVCTNAKSPLRDKIVAARDGCLAFEEGR